MKVGYLCRAPQLEEFGLSTHGLPQPLLRLLFDQLRIGTTKRDVIFLFGRAIYRQVRRVLKDLEARSLIEKDVLRWSMRADGDGLRFDAEMTEIPAEIVLPNQSALLVQTGTIPRFPLPVSLHRQLRPLTTVYDIGVAGGQLVLAFTQNSNLCASCLLLWFFGSRVLPMSFLSSCLNERGMPPVSSRQDRIERALGCLEASGAAILYFAHDESVVIDRPIGRHPACGCTRHTRT